MKSISDRLFEARDKKKMTQKELAAVIGVNKLTVCHWEKGRQNPAAHATDLAKALGISERWLMTGERTTVPLLGYIAAGGGAPIDPNAATETTTDFSNGNADFALEVTGDSMEPKIQHGDIVYMKSTAIHFEPLENDEYAYVPLAAVKPLDGKIVAATFRDAGILKRLEVEHKKQKGKYLCRFVSLNKKYNAKELHFGDECRIQGVMIGIWRTV